MSRPDDLHASRPRQARPARFGRTVLIEWIQPREPYGGWSHYAFFEPEEVQTCLSTGHLIHDDDNVKVLAGSAMIVGDDERVMLSGIIEIPARCVVRIVRLEEVSD
ncbi:hypothetical protein [Sphingopyxis sp.]|uniref:hypothetical protein n=1 Tax=Sphingopyxis sp. TaxID=1908224 RepID=UPI002D794EB2|nr:hypothetical protein [Sphingopyxis sp.]HET6524749.1 hypothetical protein [Sphingopyxis sp.]